MNRRPIEEVLESLDKPAEPRREFAETLSRRLMAELTGEAEVKAAKPRRPMLLRRPVLAAAAAAVAIALLLAGIPFLSQPRTALAAVEEARREFKNLPPFHAVIERVRPGSLLGEHLGVEGLPDERVVAEIWYASDTRWRREQVENSWDALGNPGLLQDRPGGHFQVADGEFVAEYYPLSRRLSVAPFDEQRPIELRSDATGNLAPERYGKLLNFRSEFFQENCVLLADARLLERTARHIRCKVLGGSFETWLDKETGLLLNHRDSEGVLFRVKSVEFSPTFPPDTFAVSAPEGAKARWSGEKPAPDRFRIKPGPEVVAVIPAGVAPVPIAYGEGSIWVGTILGRRQPPVGPSAVMRIDAATNEVVATIPTKGASSLVAAGGYVWVASGDGFLQRIDPKTNQASEPVKIGGFPGGLAYGSGSLWLLSGSEGESRHGETPKGSIARIDPRTGEVTATIPFPGLPWGEPSVGFGSVWAPVMTPGPFKSGEQVTISVHRVDTATNQVVATIDLGAPGWTVGAFTSGIWVPNQFEDRPTGTVTRVDPVTYRIVGVIPVGFMPTGVVEAEGFIWVMNQGDGTVTKIDPRTNLSVGEITVGAGPARAVFFDGYLWITNNTDGTVVRVRI